MKKRLTILISTILSVLCSVALGVYTIVSTTKGINPNPDNGGKHDVTVLPDAEVTEETFNFILGSSRNDVVLIENKDAISEKQDLIVFENDAFVAKKVGEATVEIAKSEKQVLKIKIVVLDKGNGSAENPFVVGTVEDLLDLVNNPNFINSDETYIKQIDDLDLSNIASWKPIGDYGKAFLANYDGNGFKVKGLKIVITAENLNEYVFNRESTTGTFAKCMTLGFFGRVGDSANSPVIKNLNIVDGVIDTTAVDGTVSTLDICYVGMAIGELRYGTLTADESASVSANIYSTLANNASRSLVGQISGLVGFADKATVSNYNVVTNIDTKNQYSFEKDGKFYGSKYSGLVGRVRDSKVLDCNVQFSFNGLNYMYTSVSGAINSVETSNSAYATEVVNVIVKKANIVVRRFTNDVTVAAKVSGFVDQVLIKGTNVTLVKDCGVDEIYVDGIGTSQVAGFVNINEAKIENCYVKGANLQGAYSAGFVFINYSTAQIIYSDFAGACVDATIYTQNSGAGFAYANYGTISAEVAGVEVNTAIMLVSPKTNDSYLAGLVAENNSQFEIKNFVVNTGLYNVQNAGGAIGRATVGSVLNGLTVNSIIQTSANAKFVGGIIARVGDATEGKVVIKNVDGFVSVNDEDVRTSGKTYDIEIFGAIVGSAGSPVEILNDTQKTMYAVVYFNSASAETMGNAYIGAIIGASKSDSNRITEGCHKVTNLEVVMNVFNETSASHVINSVIAYDPVSIANSSKSSVKADGVNVKLYRAHA